MTEITCTDCGAVHRIGKFCNRCREKHGLEIDPADMPRIFLALAGQTGRREFTGIAVAEDGGTFPYVVSSSLAALREDMHAPEMRARFAAHYPDSCELVWLGQFAEVSDDYRAALSRAREKFPAYGEVDDQRSDPRRTVSERGLS